MTIYECLGIGEILFEEMIPTELIIQNIDNAKLKCDASVFFHDINRVSVRASLNRNNHFIQVIEVELNSADHISEISILIQKAIRYQVLFVFIYEERFLILRRSFNLTMSTEHVYTEHASFCTDWIYKENLEDDLMVLLNVREITDYDNESFELPFQPKTTSSDNGDHRYFDDLIGNVKKLNSFISENDVVSMRFLLDWFAFHVAGLRVDIYDVLDKVRQIQAYQIIGNHLFVEKSCVRYAICELAHSEYTVSLDHTGKFPMLYYQGVRTLATHDDADELIQYLLYGSGKLYDDAHSDDALEDMEVLSEVKRYVRIPTYDTMDFIPTYSISKSRYVDEIIRRHQLRHSHLIEDQLLRFSIQWRLCGRGFQALEDFCELPISSVDFFDDECQIELILCMDKFGLRFQDCSNDKYPHIDDYIKSHYSSSQCGEVLDGLNLY